MGKMWILGNWKDVVIKLLPELVLDYRVMRLYWQGFGRCSANGLRAGGFNRHEGLSRGEIIDVDSEGVKVVLPQVRREGGTPLDTRLAFRKWTLESANAFMSLLPVACTRRGISEALATPFKITSKWPNTSVYV